MQSKNSTRANSRVALAFEQLEQTGSGLLVRRIAVAGVARSSSPVQGHQHPLIDFRSGCQSRAKHGPDERLRPRIVSRDTG